MRPLSISESAKKIFPIKTKRELIDLKETDFPTVSSVILTKNDLDWIKKIESLCFDIPIIIVIEEGKEDEKTNIPKLGVAAVIEFF